MAQCNEVSYLTAIYIDTLNKANIKAGVAFSDNYEYNEELPHYYGSFSYADIEIGVEGNKFTAGFGSEIGHGIDRFGISYARLKTQDLLGIEAVISQMGMSTKFGWYYGLENTKNRWLIGIGFGF